MASSRASSDPGVATHVESSTAPCSSTTPARTLVPPTSIPIAGIRRPLTTRSDRHVLNPTIAAPLGPLRVRRGSKTGHADVVLLCPPVREHSPQQRQRLGHVLHDPRRVGHPFAPQPRHHGAPRAP